MPARSEIDYVEAPIRAFAIATMFWGVVGFLMGVIIASQLAWPLLNLDLEWTGFGRLRPVHTSAVIFAFGGNALLGTSLYIVQRTCRARLFGGNDMGWFLFFGYQFFIVSAALGYVLGVTQGKEYAEPEWYVDLWLALVWVLYLAAFTCPQGSVMRPSGLQEVCRAAARRQFAANDLKPRAKAANRNPYFWPCASDVARFRPSHTTWPGRTLN
jgi:cbb3-type cytochrome c oxidase subunit I